MLARRGEREALSAALRIVALEYARPGSAREFGRSIRAIVGDDEQLAQPFRLARIVVANGALDHRLFVVRRNDDHAEMPGTSAYRAGRSRRSPTKISTAKKPVRTAIGATSTKVRIVRPIKLRPRRNSGRWTYAAEPTKANSLILGRFGSSLRF